MHLHVVSPADRVAQLGLGGVRERVVPLLPVAPDAGDVGEQGQRHPDPLACGEEGDRRLDEHFVLGQEILAQAELVVG